MFRGLSNDALGTLTENVRTLDYSPGNVVITEGTLGDTLYIIVEGSVEVVINLEANDETILAVLKRGQIFGEMCLIESLPRSASVRAQGDPTVLHAVHKSDLHRLFKTAPEQFSLLILNIARGLSRRLRRVDQLYAARAT